MGKFGPEILDFPIVGSKIKVVVFKCEGMRPRIQCYGAEDVLEHCYISLNFAAFLSIFLHFSAFYYIPLHFFPFIFIHQHFSAFFILDF